MQVARSDRRRRWYLRWRSLLSRGRSAVTPMSRPVSSTTATSVWQRLRDACQIPTGAVLQLAHRDGLHLTVPLCDPCTLVGNGPACTVRLDDPGLHAVQIALVWHGGRLFVIDADRTSFGPLDATANNPWRWGQWTAAVTGMLNSKTAIATGPVATLDWHDAGPTRPTQLSRPITVIGSAAVCSVQLVQPGVAPLQAALLRTESAVWLINLAERGGLRVNGRMVDFAPLDPGDEITFGSVPATLSAGWMAAEPSAATTASLSEQQARIADLEARLALVKQLITASGDTQSVEAPLVELQVLATDLEREFLGVPVGTVAETFAEGPVQPRRPSTHTG